MTTATISSGNVRTAERSSRASAWSAPLSSSEASPWVLIASTLSEADARPKPAPELTEDDFIPGVELPWVIAVPPKVVIRLRGKIVGHRPVRHDLGLSDAEIANLMADEDNE